MVAWATRATSENATGMDRRWENQSESAVRQIARWMVLIAIGNASCDPPRPMSCMETTMVTIAECNRYTIICWRSMAVFALDCMKALAFS